MFITDYVPHSVLGAGVSVCVCVTYNIYPELQIVLTVKQEMCLSQGWEGRRESFFKYGRRSGKAFLRTEHADWDLKEQKEANRWCLGEETSKLEEQNGPRPEAGRSLGFLKNRKGASSGETSWVLIRLFLAEGPQVDDHPKDEPIWTGKRVNLQPPWPINASKRPYLPLVPIACGKMPALAVLSWFLGSLVLGARRGIGEDNEWKAPLSLRGELTYSKQRLWWLWRKARV